MVNILLAAPHAVTRLGLQTLIAPVVDLVVIGEASDPHTLLVPYDQSIPHVAVVDAFFFESSLCLTHNFLSQWKSVNPFVYLLFLLANNTQVDVAKLIPIGVSGFLLWSDVTTHLPTAVRAIAQGDCWLSKSLACTLAGPATSPTFHPLTAREVTILQQVVSGATDKVAAQPLGICERTLRSQLRNICDKLNVNTRIEAAVQAVKLGIL